MAYALVASTSQIGSPNSTTTSAINTTGANLIVIGIPFYTGSSLTVTVSDSKSNTWTGLSSVDGAGDGLRAKLYYCFSPTVGSGHTFTSATNSTYAAVFVLAFSGAATSPFDQENTHGASSQVTSLTTGSVTPSENNELLVALLSTNTATSHSIDSSFTASVLDYVGGSSVGGGMAYKIQTSLGAENPTWSWTSAIGAAASIATFKASSGGGGGFKSAWARGSNQVLGL